MADCRSAADSPVETDRFSRLSSAATFASRRSPYTEFVAAGCPTWSGVGLRAHSHERRASA